VHVFSTAQLRTLLDLPRDATEVYAKLLDVGAGDGEITAQAIPLTRTKHQRVIVTEVDPMCLDALRKRGWRAAETGTLEHRRVMKHKGVDGYDLILCLHVLDRCRRPVSLLAQVFSIHCITCCLPLTGMMHGTDSRKFIVSDARAFGVGGLVAIFSCARATRRYGHFWSLGM
jgi:2-polyprenyl-3-methyl-5-hydroxy-6-metoxy-1,4-benzoquinol methylase